MPKRKYLVSIVLGLLLAGCAAQSPAGYSTHKRPPQRPFIVPDSINALFNRQETARLIRGATFGPIPGDIGYVGRIGAAEYLDSQFNPYSIRDSLCRSILADLPVLTMTPKELYENYPPPFVLRRKYGKDYKINPKESTREIIVELEAADLIRDVYSDRQIQALMTEFWMNHFNIYALKPLVPYYLVDFTNRIRRNALGNFSDLLKSVATSPAMLIYLDNAVSAAPDFAARKRGDLFRLRRELGPFAGRNAYLDRLGTGFFKSKGLNENYGRELLELHTVGLHYTQRDVIAAARCLTGWTVKPIMDGGGFLYDPFMHDEGEKSVLGLTIPPGGGFNDGMELLDYIANSPLTAHHISRELCEFFISDNPPAKLVDRIANVFMASHGNIRRVLLAIFLSNDFRDGDYHKFKNPYEYIVSAIRGADASFYPSKQLFGFIRSMGLVPYLVNSPKGYSELSKSWIDPDIILEHANFAMALANNRIKHIDVNYGEMFANGVAATPGELEDDFAREVLGSPLDAKTRDAVDREATRAHARMGEIYALLLDSPQFQMR